MFSFLRRREFRREPDGAEALLAMTPRELADLPFWVEPPQPDGDGGAGGVTARTAPRRLPA
ncbi:hypothetical protein ACFW16_32185 [Inquilinus sp. NPDC058860]|uniref:hypothetical protein n=1 Tax=Inquilinus sp. NPDC058860 TaxID=3346652 RepID=UPI0036AC9064